MNILVAMNAFKGTLSSIEVNQIIDHELSALNHNVISIPISDGGDGFLDAISKAIKGTFIEVESLNPIGKKNKSTYYLSSNSAYIELAKISGLSLISKEQRNPLVTSTYGLGMVIKHAIQKGVKKIYIGIGGSATNDGGAGMLQALGVKFYQNNKIIDKAIGGDLLGLVTHIDTNVLDKLISNVEIEVMSDVDNPLLGLSGCAAVYAPQKGASKSDIKKLEEHMVHYADLIESHFNKNYRDIDGSGAAGGVGFGLLAFLNAKLHIGIDYMISLLKIEEHIKSVDYVIVGEGKLDEQTTHGKAPYGIAIIAKKYQKKVIGIFALKDETFQPDFLDECYTIVPKYMKMEASLKNPNDGLREITKDISFI